MSNIRPFSPPMWQERLTAWGVGSLLAILRLAGGEGRVVGGAVRDALLGRKVEDVDLAATLPPDQLMAAFAKEGIKTVPTGYDHGTITAILNHKPYQITTLRSDVATDGRWADVAFTDDWQADAARRDFTINAFYVGEDGAFYDYHDGLSDLQNCFIRFIGEPEARIREDVLRILRAFRFWAQLGGTIDPRALSACTALAPLLPSLSGERVQNEVLKLLAAPAPSDVWRVMVEKGVLGTLLPKLTNWVRLARLERTASGQEPLCRLASLINGGKDAAATVAATLRLSRAQTLRLCGAVALSSRMGQVHRAFDLRQVLYDHGAEVTRDALALWLAQEEGRTMPAGFEESIAAWERPVFPLAGRDLQALGAPPGPAMGETLRRVEQWWRDQDFKPDAAACLAQAKSMMT